MKAHKQPKITLGVIIGISFAFTLIALFAVGSKVIFGNPDTPRLLNYQGKLTDANGPVTGTVSITFSIYDTPTGGSPLWTEPHGNVIVTNGLFNAILGGTTPIPDSVFNGGERYLGLIVDGEEMTPRQQIVSVIFALKAQDADLLDGLDSTDLQVTSVDGLSGGTINGSVNIGADPDTYNLVVSGNITAKSLQTLWDINVRDVNAEYLHISKESSAGGFVDFYANGRNIARFVVDSNLPDDLKIYSPTGQLVLWDDVYIGPGNRDLTVSGELDCYDYLNIYNQSDETRRAARIYGNGTNLEIYTENPDDKVIINGPLRITTRTGEGYGEISFGTKGSGHVFLRETDNRDLEIEVPSGRTVKVLGNLTATGSKPALVTTHSYGKRYVYAEEAAEIYFFDRGGGKLINGQATIYLDPIFLETVTIDADHPMRVQITLTEDCKGVYVAEKTATSFTVKELMGGTSDATFDWEVAAKRRGYENVRLKEASEKVTRRK